MIWLHRVDPSADDHRSKAQTAEFGPCLPTIRALSREGLNHKKERCMRLASQCRFL